MRSFSKQLLCAASLMLASTSWADILPAGYVIFDVVAPGDNGEFDIQNETGPNSSGDATFPITTSVNFTTLSLTVDFSDGSSQVFGSSYFTLGLDALSFNGSTIPIGGANPQPTEAVLTGTFSPTTVTLFDGTQENIGSPFSATITPSSGSDINDLDFAVINATGSPVVTSTPEVSSVVMLGTMILLVLLYRRFSVRGVFRKFNQAMSAGTAASALLVGCALLIPATNASAQVKLALATSPSSGNTVAGVNFVTVSGSGFPTTHGTIPATDATFSFSLTCDGAIVATAAPSDVRHIIGGNYVIQVLLPASLGTKNYFLSLTGTTSSGFAYSSLAGSCSEVAVTHISKTLAACVPTSSLGISAPGTGTGPVKAYVPKGSWGSGSSGIDVVQLEAGGGPVVAPVAITTTALVNSCAGTPNGEGVCVDNGTGVYHVDSSDNVTKLVSGGNALSAFSGGQCINCGVAVNAQTNQAVIAMGYSPSPSQSALQILNLGTNTFAGAPVAQDHEISEDISIDPNRGYILSPNEADIYNIVQFNSTTGLLTGEFANVVGAPAVGFGEFDSAAEDCTTGIALASVEFTSNVYIADLTQASFTPGTPGSWSAPQSVITLNGSFAAGTSGISVAPGSGHQAVVTGEFGGSAFAVLQLPSTSGTGTPSIVDYAYVECLTGFSAGFDPHTVSAYTSPNDGKAYGVFVNWASGPATNLYVADTAAILAAPRFAGTHTVIGDSGGSCLTPGDGMIRSVATH